VAGSGASFGPTSVSIYFPSEALLLLIWNKFS
jgi:hypothetical protein